MKVERTRFWKIVNASDKAKYNMGRILGAVKFGDSIDDPEGITVELLSDETKSFVEYMRKAHNEGRNKLYHQILRDSKKESTRYNLMLQASLYSEKLTEEQAKRFERETEWRNAMTDEVYAWIRSIFAQISVKAMKEKNKVSAVRKEDEIYYNALYWIIAPTEKDILENKEWKLVGYKYGVGYDGKPIENKTSAEWKEWTHKAAWQKEFAEKYKTDDYMYYPRGRVTIGNADGKLHINTNSRVDLPWINEAVVKFVDGKKLQEIIWHKDEGRNGSHYEYHLT